MNLFLFSQSFLYLLQEWSFISSFAFEAALAWLLKTDRAHSTFSGLSEHLPKKISKSWEDQVIEIVHELIPFFASPQGEKQYRFLITSGCLLSRWVWWVVWIGSFCPKLRYFTSQNGPKGGPHENEFWLVSNTKMNVTNSRKSRNFTKFFNFKY